MTLDQEVQAAIATLNKLPKVVMENRKPISALGGAYMASAIEAATPRGNKVHFRYSTAKGNKSMRAPKGMGTIVATYQPGNLQNSLQVLKLNRAKTSTYVGARLAKGKAAGTFGAGIRTDGYYAHMVDGGTVNMSGRHYFVPARDRATPTVLSIMLRQWERLIDKFGLEHSISTL
jgi:hypothetical protein